MDVPLKITNVETNVNTHRWVLETVYTTKYFQVISYKHLKNSYQIFICANIVSIVKFTYFFSFFKFLNVLIFFMVLLANPLTVAGLTLLTCVHLLKTWITGVLHQAWLRIHFKHRICYGIMYCNLVKLDFG